MSLPRMSTTWWKSAVVYQIYPRSFAGSGGRVGTLEGADRKRFVERMQLDYQDFAMLGDAEGAVEDGFLVLRVDLRPDDAR